MAFLGEGERPGGALEPVRQTHLTPGEQGGHETGRSHEQLVNVFRDLIHQQAEVYAELRSPHEREILPAEAIVHNVLEWYSAPETGGEETFTLRCAWDALAFDRYEVGSREEREQDQPCEPIISPAVNRPSS